MKDYSIQEVASINSFPVVLDFIDYIRCPVCDYEASVVDMVVDNHSSDCCENCEHVIKFKIKKV